MIALSTQTAGQMIVAFPGALVVVGSFFGALIVALLLVWAVQIGIRNMMREPPRPEAREHGRLPDEGPVHESRERREPEEVPEYEERDRLTPHEIPGFGNTSSKTSDNQKPRKWHPGTSGSFGSGGPGGG